MKKIISAVLLVLFAVWFLYDQTGEFEFLRLDDHDYTFRCAFVYQGLSVQNIVEAFRNFTHAAIWMPATYVSYMLDISLWGPSIGAHHLMSVAYHSLNAVLLFFLLLALVRKMRPQDEPSILLPLLGALFWALHPQRAEAVAWIAGRKDILCCTFVLAGLLCWLRETGPARLGACLFGALAMMSKPTAMCYPFLILALDLLAARGVVRNRRVGFCYLPLLLMAIATGVIAIYSQTHVEGYLVRELFSASLAWRVLNALVAVGLSLAQFVVPVGVHLDYRSVPGQFPVDGVLGLAVCGVAAGALALLAWRVRAARRPLAALALFFFAALGPTLGIFGSFGEHARADRFLYLPMLAFPMALVLWRPSRPRLVAVAGALAVLAAGALAYPLVASYRNDYTAFSRTLACDPAHGRALAHVASEECARFNHIDKGIALYRRSQELRPRDDTAAQLAYALMMRARSEDYAEIRRLCAKFACDHALDRKGMALEALGTTAMRQRRWTEAISCLKDSVNAPARFYSADDAKLNLGASYCNAGFVKEAIAILEPLTQSRRNDISSRAQQALATIKANPKALLFF